MPPYFLGHHLPPVVVVYCLRETVENASDVGLVELALCSVGLPQALQVIVVFEVQLHRAFAENLLAEGGRKYIRVDFGLQEVQRLIVILLVEVPLREDQIRAEMLAFLADVQKHLLDF